MIIWTGFKVDEKVNSATQRRKVEERFAVGFNIPEMDVAILKTDRNLFNGMQDHFDDLGKLDKSDIEVGNSMAIDISHGGSPRHSLD